MKENHLGDFICARLHARPAVALPRTQENTLEELFPNICHILRGTHVIYVAPVFAPARMQEKNLDKLFMCWLRARGYFGSPT